MLQGLELVREPGVDSPKQDATISILGVNPLNGCVMESGVLPFS